MTPTKVIIEITARGDKTSIYSGSTLLCERENVMVSAGESRSCQKGDFYDDLPDHDDLAEALEDGLCFGVFSIAQALYYL